MSWAIGHDTRWCRDVGYGVPATCDQPECGAEIDRGLAYVCGEEPMGGEYGCGLYFCGEHLSLALGVAADDPDEGKWREKCERCHAGQPPFTPTPDVEEWVRHKRCDPSWARWRAGEGMPEPIVLVAVEFVSR